MKKVWCKIHRVYAKVKRNHHFGRLSKPVYVAVCPMTGHVIKKGGVDE